jgi:outer membrane protein assembly factor BamB
MPERRESWSRTTRHSTQVSARVLLALAAVALLGRGGLSVGVSHAARHGYAVHTIRLQPGVSATAFDTRSNRLFVATTATIDVRDAATGGLLQTVRLPMPALQGWTTLLLDPLDGRLIVGTTQDARNTTSSGAITTIDTHTGRVLRTVQAGTDATPLVVDQRSKLALVASSVAAHGGRPGVTIARLAFVDVRDGQPVAHATLPGSVQDWVFDPGRERALLVYPLVLQDGWESRYAIVDTWHGRILPGHDRDATGPLPLLDLQRGWAMAVDSTAGLVRVVATATGRVLRTIRVGALPQAQALDPHTATGYVVSLSGVRADSQPSCCTFSILDLARGIVRREVNIGPGAEGLSLSTSGDRAYISFQSGQLLVVDTTSAKVLGAVDVGSMPRNVPAVTAHGFAYSLQDGTVDADWTTHPSSRGTLYVLDAKTGRLVRTISLGTTSDPQPIEDVAHGTLLWVTGMSAGPRDSLPKPGLVTVLQASSGKLLQQIPLGLRPAPVGFDARTGRLLVLNMMGDGTAPPSADPQELACSAVPGSPLLHTTRCRLPYTSLSIIDALS